MTTATIDRKALKAVSRFQGVKDVRFYLNGVYLQSNEMQTRLIATDGRTMGIHRDDRKGENFGNISVIIPAHVVKTVLGWKLPKSAVNTVTIHTPKDYKVDGTDSESECRIISPASGDMVVFKAIDAKFPDYQRVIPTECNGEFATINPNYLCRAFDANNDLTGKEYMPHVHMNGQGAAVAIIGSSMVCVFMPMRGAADTEMADSAWVREALPELPADETPEQELLAA